MFDSDKNLNLIKSELFKAVLFAHNSISFKFKLQITKIQINQTKVRKMTVAARRSKRIPLDKKALKKAAPTRATIKKSKPSAKATKKSLKTRTPTSNNKKKLLELGLLLDCTGSMASWIARAKTTLQELIENVVASCDGNLDVRVCFVGYRDHCDAQRFTIQEFSKDVQEVKNFISKVTATGGGDFPEDVVGGLRKCLDQTWSPHSSK